MLHYIYMKEKNMVERLPQLLMLWKSTPLRNIQKL